MMKKFVQGAIVGLSLLSLAACGQVHAGYVGVKVHNLGSDSGVQAEEIGVGYEWLGMGTDMYLFPTFEQNYVWTAAIDEGSPNNESFSFQDSDGLDINADIGISYQIIPDRASDLFETYRLGIEEITDQRIRNIVRDALNNSASAHNAAYIYGAGRVDIMEDVEEAVRERLAPQGIQVNDIYWIGSLRLPPQVQRAIEMKVEADQEAAQRENQIATATAQAQIEIAEATGRAQARILEATAEADALRIQGAALRENPDILMLNAIEKWDGALSQYSSSGGESSGLPFFMRPVQ